MQKLTTVSEAPAMAEELSLKHPETGQHYCAHCTERKAEVARAGPHALRLSLLVAALGHSGPPPLPWGSPATRRIPAAILRPGAPRPRGVGSPWGGAGRQPLTCSGPSGWSGVQVRRGPESGFGVSSPRTRRAPAPPAGWGRNSKRKQWLQGCSGEGGACHRLPPTLRPASSSPPPPPPPPPPPASPPTPPGFSPLLPTLRRRGGDLTYGLDAGGLSTCSFTCWYGSKRVIPSLRI